MINSIVFKGIESFEEINFELKKQIEKAKKEESFLIRNNSYINFNKYANDINFKIFPFNFYLYEDNGDFLVMSREQLELNLKNFNKLYIKNNDGNSMKKYIMYQFFEEFNQLLGNFDINFINSDSLKKYFLEKYGVLPSSILFFLELQPKNFRKNKRRIA